MTHELCQACGERILTLEVSRMFDEKVLVEGSQGWRRVRDGLSQPNRTHDPLTESFEQAIALGNDVILRLTRLRQVPADVCMTRVAGGGVPPVPVNKILKYA